MGNGRRLGRTSGSRPVLVRALASVVVLLLAGLALLGTGSRPAQNVMATQMAASPIPAFSHSSPSRFSSHAKPDARALLGQLPLIFEPNQGQADPGMKFVARGAGYSLFLNQSGAVLGMRTAHSSPGRAEHFVRMKLVGADAGTLVSGTDPLPGKSNYFVGNDPHSWRSGIPQFGGVRYRRVYPGIDLVFYGNQGHLEYDFKVAPGADPSQAELQFDGASKLELNHGDLLLTGKSDGDLRLQAPQFYQRDGDRRIPVAGHFVLRAANRIGFEVGAYDHSRELVIDPVLFFSTYFGGSGSETSPSVAIDPAGNIYLAGTTLGSPENSFTSSSTQTLLPPALSLSSTSPSHIFVARISPSQPPTVAYEAFIGGSGSDTSAGIGVDGGGNAYIVGNTSSADFPTGGIPYQTAPETKGTQCASITCTSVFVSVLNAAGSALTYSSYLSGNGNDQASGMTIDANGDVFLTGTTTSNDAPAISPVPVDFPATQLPVPFQVTPNGPIQFFATKVNTKAPGVASIAYSTYFGGGVVSSGTVAVGGGIAVDSTGNMYFTGTTNFYNSGQGSFGGSTLSTDFPVLNAYQPCLDTPPPTILANPNPCSAPATTPYPTDAFLAKLNPNAQAGTQLLFSTYLGGTAADSSTAVAIDSGAANIYLTGTTNSADFVLPIGMQAFQGCLNNPGIVVSATSQCPAQTTTNTDAYVARFNNPVVSTNGTQVNVGLAYLSYLGGSLNESGSAITVDTAGDALLTGATNSTNFPATTPNPLQGALSGIQNAFFASLNTTTTTSVNGVGSFVSYFGGNGVDRGTSIVVDPVSLNTYFAGDTTSTNFQTQNGLQTTLNGPSDAFVAELVPAPSVCITCTAPTFSTTGIVSAGNQLTITFTVTNQGPDLATGVFVSGSVSSGVTFNSATAGSGSCSTPVSNMVVCTIPTLQAGSTSSVNFAVTPTGPCTACSATAQVIKINNTNTNITPAIASFQAGGFSMGISPSSRTVAAGGVAQYTVQVTPQPSFGGNVSLTCSAPPTGAACNFTSSTLGPLNGPQSATLNLTTTPQPVTTVASRGWHGPLYALWLMVPGISLLGISAGSKRLRRRWIGLLALSMLFALVLLQPSCSSSTKTPAQVSGTPTGTYSMTVTATSGSLTKSAGFQLSVTP
ncbi:MAG: hypothetical protein JWQ87_2448 [Candidatus Sulfotelmatobacter sp.]|nr:hypothetical protein [Candidatus Sulfotelmatobacter sp.]